MTARATRLVFDFDGTRTVLAESRSELPLQVQRPIISPDGAAVVTLLTPAGALFDGDEIHLSVECRPGSDVTLRQVGGTRLHRCERLGIRCEADVEVAAGARFRFLPNELIPFAGSAYRQTIRLQLAHGAEAGLTEVVTPGRLGEHFGYRSLDLCTE